MKPPAPEIEQGKLDAPVAVRLTSDIAERLEARRVEVEARCRALMGPHAKCSTSDLVRTAIERYLASDA